VSVAVLASYCPSHVIVEVLPLLIEVGLAVIETIGLVRVTGIELFMVAPSVAVQARV
jgi:hypothetical protein